MRAVSVRAINLVRDTEPVQVGMFDNVNRELKRDRIETAMEDIRLCTASTPLHMPG